jgi:hypothetical protein
MNLKTRGLYRRCRHKYRSKPHNFPTNMSFGSTKLDIENGWRTWQQHHGIPTVSTFGDHGRLDGNRDSMWFGTCTMKGTTPDKLESDLSFQLYRWHSCEFKGIKIDLPTTAVRNILQALISFQMTRPSHATILWPIDFAVWHCHRPGACTLSMTSSSAVDSKA